MNVSKDSVDLLLKENNFACEDSTKDTEETRLKVSSEDCTRPPDERYF